MECWATRSEVPWPCAGGGRLSERTFYRVYGRYFDRDGFVDAEGRPTSDDWRFGRMGGRLDWEGQADTVSLMADVFGGELDQTLVEALYLEPPYLRVIDFETDLAGGFVQGRWQRRPDSNSVTSLGLYYDYGRRHDIVIVERRHTLDLDFQQQYSFGRRHDLVWGLSYRFTTDDSDSTFMALADPRSRRLHLWSAFAQDEMELLPERLRLTLGSKFEHNTFTGVEVQPNAQLLWKPGSTQVLWGAVSRAVRLPTRSENDGRFLYGVAPIGGEQDDLVIVVHLQNSSALKSEEVVSFELGYRVRPHPRLWIDVAGFYNLYDRLRTGEPQTPVRNRSATTLLLRVDGLADDDMNARTWGFEPVADWQVRDNWRIRTGYTYLHMRMSLDASSMSANSLQIAGDNPEHQFYLRSATTLPGGMEFDWMVRYVDEVPFSKTASYFTTDVHLGWKMQASLELALAGHNLLDAHHREFDPELIDTEPTEIERSAHLSLRYRF